MLIQAPMCVYLRVHVCACLCMFVCVCGSVCVCVKWLLRRGRCQTSLLLECGPSVNRVSSGRNKDLTDTELSGPLVLIYCVDNIPLTASNKITLHSLCPPLLSVLLLNGTDFSTAVCPRRLFVSTHQSDSEKESTVHRAGKPIWAQEHFCTSC